jgi:hypothetical protein
MNRSLNKSKKDISNSKVTIRHKKLFKFEQIVHGQPARSMIKKIHDHEANGYIRENMFGKEIIWGTKKFIYNNPGTKRSRKHLFIFSLVKKDALKFIKDKKIKREQRLPSVQWNNSNRSKARKVGVDVDGAYWLIAFQMGLIGENTYQHGIRIDNKALCLAALASLGTDKSYRRIKNGQITSEIVTVKGNDQLKEAYKKVRFRCYKYMQELARQLGPDFVCYKTDCIYFLDRAGNSQKVKEFLLSKRLDFKMVNNFEKFRSENE